MPVYCLGLMIYFNNFSTGMWLYTALHGSYGVFWYMGYCLFPNKGFSIDLTIASAFVAYAIILGPYCIAAYQIASSNSEEAQEISGERMAIAVLMYVFGIVLMLGADAQKHFVIMNKPGLM